jgi:hypothetical protein
MALNLLRIIIMCLKSNKSEIKSISIEVREYNAQRITWLNWKLLADAEGLYYWALSCAWFASFCSHLITQSVNILRFTSTTIIIIFIICSHELSYNVARLCIVRFCKRTHQTIRELAKASILCTYIFTQLSSSVGAVHQYKGPLSWIACHSIKLSRKW